MTQRTLSFRRGDVLATTFTGTLTERHGEPAERIPTPDRFMDWLQANGLQVTSCSASQLGRAQELRESIHAVATATATRTALPTTALLVINSCSSEGRAVPELTPDGTLRWQLENDAVEDALSVIAGDATALVSGGRNGRLALCASETCRAVFLDTSQSRTRRWCDMNSCGNRGKKDRLKARQANAESTD